MSFKSSKFISKKTCFYARLYSHCLDSKAIETLFQKAAVVQRDSHQERVVEVNADDLCPVCGAKKEIDYELGGMGCPNYCAFRLPPGGLL